MGKKILVKTSINHYINFLELLHICKNINSDYNIELFFSILANNNFREQGSLFFDNLDDL